MTVYDFTVQTADGKEISLNKYEGEVLLIVNTASKCGFSPQLKELQMLHDTYKDKGFTILGFPSDQFMNQEFADIQDTLDFCQTNYGVDFPIYAKTKVKGEDSHPLFSFLTGSKKGFFTNEIKWNFTKFLINRQGYVVKRYAPQTKPFKIAKDLEDLLQVSINIFLKMQKPVLNNTNPKTLQGKILKKYQINNKTAFVHIVVTESPHKSLVLICLLQC